MSTIYTQGRVCYKTTGRDAGKKVIVVEDAKNGFAIVEGMHTKKGKCNVNHLLPTINKVELRSNYSRDELKKMLGKGE
jgi:large subunit ribosomal protein L14e